MWMSRSPEEGPHRVGAEREPVHQGSIGWLESVRNASAMMVLPFQLIPFNLVPNPTATEMLGVLLQLGSL